MSLRCAAYAGYSLSRARRARSCKTRRLSLAERRVSFVSDEHVASDEVPEPGAAGSQAEVDLDAVIAAERVAVEPAHGAQAIAAEIEHRPLDERKLLRSAGVGSRELRIEQRHRLAFGQRIRSTRNRIGGDADAVRERRDDAHVARARLHHEPVQPIVGDFGIGVQHHDIAIAMEVEAAVDGGGKASPRGLLEDLNAVRLHEVVQSARAVAPGGSIVDHDDFVLREDFRPAHALDAPAQELGVVLERNDDVDDHRRLSSRRWRSAIRGKRSQPRAVSR
jgi:hypothetical protein